MTAMAVEGAATASTARVSRALPFPGRRRRAAGERIAALFEEHGRMVYGISRLLLRDPVEAEDAAQQTFLSAYRALLAGQQPRDPSAWLGTIARNECRQRLRSRQTEPVTLVQEPAGDELQRDVARHEEIQALCAALAELPPQQRDAVVLRELYGLSYAEVAAALGLSGAAVESLLFRARRRLQEQLRPVRSALGMLVLPVSLRDSLAQALPGFGSAGVSAGGGAVLAKLASAPIAAKLAAATLAIGTVGTVAGVEHEQHARRPPAPVPVPTPLAVVHVRPRPVSATVPPVTRPVVRVTHVSRERRRSGSRGDGGEQHGSGGSGGGEVEVEQEARSVVTTTSSSGDGGSGPSGGHESGEDSHHGGGDSGSDGSGSGESGGSGSGDSGSGRGSTGSSGPGSD